MKRLAMLLGLFAGIATASAQSLSFGGGPHVGLSISSFPKAIKDYYGMGLVFGAHGDLNIVKFLSVRLNFTYHSFGFDKTKFIQVLAQQSNLNPSDLAFEGYTSRAILIGLDGLGKIPTGSVVTPYGVVGFGINLLSASDPKLTFQGQDVTNLAGLQPASSETKFGINFGAGSEFKVGPTMKLYLEIKYAIIFTSNESTSHIPIVIGASFGG
jgi:opacity protein-like surface antigen